MVKTPREGKSKNILGELLVLYDNRVIRMNYQLSNVVGMLL